MRPPHLTGASRKGRPNRNRPIAERVPAVVRQLLELQNELEITDRAFAAASGYADSHLALIRKGKSLPSVVALCDMAQALGRQIVMAEVEPDVIALPLSLDGLRAVTRRVSN